MKQACKRGGWRAKNILESQLKWKQLVSKELDFDKRNYMSHDTRKRVFGSFRPRQTQTGLRSHRS